MEELGRTYRECEKRDGEPAGFQRIDCADRDNSVIAYVRRGGARDVIVICKCTPVPQLECRLLVPEPTDLVCLLSGADARFGGSGLETLARVAPERELAHGFAQSIRLRLPPLAAVILSPERGA